MGDVSVKTGYGVVRAWLTRSTPQGKHESDVDRTRPRQHGLGSDRTTLLHDLGRSRQWTGTEGVEGGEDEWMRVRSRDIRPGRSIVRVGPKMRHGTDDPAIWRRARISG